jgi:hypothetical protein
VQPWPIGHAHLVERHLGLSLLRGVVVVWGCWINLYRVGVVMVDTPLNVDIYR